LAFYSPHSGRLTQNTKMWFRVGKLADAGPHIDQDPSYSAGITIDHLDANVVYLSRMVGGRDELERWETADLGRSWTVRPITTGSTRDNLRPVVPRGISGDRALLWTWGSYRYFKDYADLVVMLRGDFAASS
jgi:hypothetical protein